VSGANRNEEHDYRVLALKERRLIFPLLKPVVLQRGTVLFGPDDPVEYFYFPVDALVSYLSGTVGGESIEIGLVGNEGMAGIASLLGDAPPFRAVVQVAGSALRIGRDALSREFRQNENLRALLLRYANALLIQIAQTAVCNKFHSVKSRFCRWLLMAQDRMGAASLHMTQETFARILGTRRASITTVAG